MKTLPTDRWFQVQQLRIAAQPNGKIMNALLTTPVARDLATKRYVSAVDKLMIELNALAEAGVLDEIAEFLEGSYGRPV